VRRFQREGPPTDDAKAVPRVALRSTAGHGDSDDEDNSGESDDSFSDDESILRDGADIEPEVRE